MELDKLYRIEENMTDRHLLNIDLPWPAKGDKLFTDDGGLYNSCINWLISEDRQRLYARSFEDASLFLLDHVTSSRSELDTFIYPIIFCFRHSLELSLKGIIQAGINNIDSWNLKEVPNGHDLLFLWSKAKHVLIECFPNEDKAVLAYVEDCIKELSTIDRNSEAFRYPISTKGEHHLSNIRYINTLNLRKTLSALSGFFNGVDGALGEMEGWINDQRSEIDYY